jgi:GntR family transcriptional regulator
VQQVRQSLLLGYLREGDQLPTVKEVTVDLAINPNTVVKAYRQLEHEGLAGGRPGQGTFITGTPAGSWPAPEASRALRQSLRRWLDEAAEAGLSQEAITALIAAVRRGTELDDTELDDTELDDTELDDTELDDTELDDTELDDTELDDTETEDLAG